MLNYKELNVKRENHKKEIEHQREQNCALRNEIKTGQSNAKKLRDLHLAQIQDTMKNLSDQMKRMTRDIQLKRMLSSR